MQYKRGKFESKTLGVFQSGELKWHRKKAYKLDKLMQHNKQRQEQGVHCDLCVGAAIGELEVVQEHFHRYQLPPVEEMCQVCQVSKRKDVTANCCCRSGKVLLARLHDSPQQFKEFLKTYCF